MGHNSGTKRQRGKESFNISHRTRGGSEERSKRESNDGVAAVIYGDGSAQIREKGFSEDASPPGLKNG